MFNDLFSFLTNPSKKIASFDEDGLLVSTVKAGDTGRYETAVRHPQFNDGKIVVVQEYDTEKEARKGHEGWLALMTRDVQPESLRDVSSYAGRRLLDVLGATRIFERKRPVRRAGRLSGRKKTRSI